MMNNYQCTECAAMISADPDLTPATQCPTCSTVLVLESAGSPEASSFIDYQCPGCGATNSAEPGSTSEMYCASCLTLIKLGRVQPQGVQENSAPPLPEPAAAPVENAMPQPEAAIENPLPQLGAATGDPMPALGAAAEDSLPQPGAATEDPMPALGAAAVDGLPQLGAATEDPMPALGAAAGDNSPQPGATAENQLPVPEDPNPSAPVPESDFKNSEINTSETTETEADTETEDEDFNPIPLNERKKIRPAWVNFLLRPRVLAVIFGMAPVMITVMAGAVFVFIRNGTAIANGTGNSLLLGGAIVLAVVALWAMYILGLTFYYADRDWVTDFGLFVVILGACWGMYAVITTFPATSPAMLGHIFYGYVSVAAIALAIWLLAPYKGIGTPR